MLENLITSKTRIKLLLKFFLNYQTTCHLRGLVTEFGESSNSIRMELLKLENAGLLISTLKGNKKLYYANTNYPFFDEINSILKKVVGIDLIIEQITSQIENLDAAYLTGDIAVGKDSKIIELALIGNFLDQEYVNSLIKKAESFLSRKINCTILTHEEMIQNYKFKNILLIYETEQYSISKLSNI
ncbi:MAG TPA: transcriptional regulator [Prolixibacteraceae bacterium]|nr:transcriptional regulator [Prolixibacteraceae bacterium]